MLQLPNTRFFASLYFGLQRIGAIPIMALPSHRYRELRDDLNRSSRAVRVASVGARSPGPYAERPRSAPPQGRTARPGGTSGRSGRPGRKRKLKK